MTTGDDSNPVTVYVPLCGLIEQLDDSRQMIEDMRQRRTVWQRVKGVFVSETG